MFLLKLKKTSLFLLIFIILVSIFSNSTYAATVYTNSLKKGDTLEFTGTAWCVYSSSSSASKLDSNKIVDYLSNGEKIVIKEKNNNVLKIGTNRYIYYGSTASKYFRKTINVKAVTLSKASITLETGKTYNLTATVAPSNANNKKVTWKSNNTNIAKVDNNGKITAVAAGTATITVTTEDGKKTAKCNVTVKDAKYIKLDQSKIYLDISKPTYTLKVTEGETNVTWASNNKNVVTVNKDGKVTRVAPGTATITATSKKDSSVIAKCAVIVEEEKVIICGPSTEVRLSGLASISGEVGDYWNFNYKDAYGYTVKADTDRAKKIYKNAGITYSTKDEEADLFFIALGGSGLRWFAGNSFKVGKTEYVLDNYVSKYNKESFFIKKGTPGEGGNTLERLLKEGNANNWHFTVIYKCSGNDLVQPLVEDKNNKTSDTNTIAKIYSKYLEKLADTYPQHEFYVFTPSPTDETKITEKNENQKALRYYIINNNNSKKYLFEYYLSKHSNNSYSNLHYNTTVVEDLLYYSKKGSTFLNENGKKITVKGGNKYTTFDGKEKLNFSCYDTKHYDKSGCRVTLEYLLRKSNVVDAKGKKL